MKALAAGASIIFLAPAHEGDILIAEALEEAVMGRSGAYSVSERASDDRAIAQFQGQSRTVGGAVVETEIEEKCNG